MIVHQISSCVHQISRFDEYPPPKPKSSNPTSSSSRLVSLSLSARDCGVWRAWLGDSGYAAFAAFLASQSSWDAFIGTDDSKSRARFGSGLGFGLALRLGRCLSLSPIFFVFFVAWRLRLLILARFEPQFAFCELVWLCGFALHGDDVYFSLEDFGFGSMMGLKLKLAQRFAFNGSVVLKNISRLCGTKPIVTINKRFPVAYTLCKRGDRVLVKVVNHVKYNLSIHWNICMNQKRNQRLATKSETEIRIPSLIPLLIRNGSETECKKSVSDSVANQKRNQRRNS
ncbi:hypothetical protein Scep_014479 [Stephania cephalantha]|uniref:Plastocyanin-like domain-containing protein n=1 Tax=Stephania cephalantha TaxID=152367 RepID=A0AAP0P0F0_9MAGN